MQKKILILGCYSNIAQDIITKIVEHIDCKIIAAGRSEDKLSELNKKFNSKKIVTKYFDLNKNIDELIFESDLVINCVGPYDTTGYEIAEKAVDSGKNYLDFAFEQNYFKKLIRLNNKATENNCFILSAAGILTGITSILTTYGLTKLKEPDEIFFYYVEGAISDPNSHFGSFMSGALQASMGLETWEDSNLKKIKVGSNRKKKRLPDPFGELGFFELPTIDNFILPKISNVKKIKTYFGMQNDVPEYLFYLLRLLNPSKFKIAYNLVSMLTKSEMKRSYKAAQKYHHNKQPIIQIEIKGQTKTWRCFVSLSGEINSTSYLPIILTKYFVNNMITKKGVIHPHEVLTPEQFFSELKQLNLGLNFEENYI